MVLFSWRVCFLPQIKLPRACKKWHLLAEVFYVTTHMEGWCRGDAQSLSVLCWLLGSLRCRWSTSSDEGASWAISPVTITPLRRGFLFLPHPRLVIFVVERLVDLVWRHIASGCIFVEILKTKRLYLLQIF